MRRSEAAGIGTAVVVLVLSVAVFFYAAANSRTVTAPKKDETVTYQYVIKEYNGIIAVFENGEGKPAEIYEVPVETLPAEDVKKLQEGIQVTTEEKLRQLLEDLTS